MSKRALDDLFELLLGAFEGVDLLEGSGALSELVELLADLRSEGLEALLDALHLRHQPAVLRPQRLHHPLRLQLRQGSK